MKTLKSLLIAQVLIALSSENLIAKTIPKIVPLAKDDELNHTLQSFAESSDSRGERLTQALAELQGEDTKIKLAKAPTALKETFDGILGVKAAIKVTKNTPDSVKSTRDAFMILMLQRFCHTQIAEYGTLCVWATELGETEVHELLGKTLDEYKDLDTTLTDIATSGINSGANAEESEPETVRASVKKSPAMTY